MSASDARAERHRRIDREGKQRYRDHLKLLRGPKVDQPASEVPELAGAKLYGDRYLATPTGDVWSCRTGKWLRRKEHAGRDGYRRVHINVGGRNRNTKVSVIVCEAFHGPKPANCSLVRHLDGSKDNDTPDNLAWGTYRENALDSVKHGTCAITRNRAETVLRCSGEGSYHARLTWEQVRAIRADRMAGAAQPELAARYNVKQTTISAICLGKTWREPGMIVLPRGRADTAQGRALLAAVLRAAAATQGGAKGG